MLYKHIFGFI